MLIGVQLPEVERVVRWPEVRAIARAAEDGGLDSIWVGDHLLYRSPDRGPHEAWTQLAALAAVTERVELGPLVACLGFHPPAVVAKLAASIDDVSGGRFRLGIGSGWNRDEFEAFGIPFDHRIDRFEDACAILEPLLRGDRATHAGDWWQAHDAVLLPAPTRPIPAMAGVAGPRALAATLPWVGWWNTWWHEYGNSAAGYAELHARIDAACERAGRPPGEVGRSACVLVGLGGDERPDPGVTPVPVDALGDHLAALEAAGADEAILVLDPITAASVTAVTEILAQR